MKFCRYDKETTQDSCDGCEHGCLNKKPVAYINRDFEEAVKEMERITVCCTVSGKDENPQNISEWSFRNQTAITEGTEGKNIPQQLQKIAETICDKYCKYPERYGEDNVDQMCDEVCDSCPIDRIF